MRSYRLALMMPIAAWLAILPLGFAQKGNQGGSTGTGNTGSTAPRQPRTTNQTTTDSGYPGTVPETIFLTGSVMQEDGTPAPFGTTIELDCGDTITKEATVDSGGHYSFQMGGA